MFAGIVSENVPAVMVCEPNVWTLIALLLCVELYSSTVSKAVDSVTVVKVKLAEGVKNATPAVADVLVELGGVAFVTVIPPAV